MREDQLDGVDTGASVQLMLADRSAPIKGRIAEIVPRGEFATWRAARVVGDYDLNTFLIRADPVGGAVALEAGMSVWLTSAGQWTRDAAETAFDAAAGPSAR